MKKSRRRKNHTQPVVASISHVLRQQPSRRRITPSFNGQSELLESKHLLSATQVLVEGLQVSPDEFSVTTQAAYFKAFQNSANEVWRIDGTTNATSRIASVDARSLTTINDTLFFVSGSQIWSSGGTEAGTQVRLDMTETQFETVQPETIIEHEGSYFFQGYDFSAQRWSIYKTDLTNIGTERITSTLYQVEVNGLTPLGQRILFTAGGFLHAVNVDGTIDYEIGDVRANLQNGSQTINGFVLASMSNTSFGEELFSTDATFQGTQPLADIAPGPDPSRPGQLTDYNGTLYFTATVDNTNQIWQTDGTQNNTRIVLDDARLIDSVSDGLLFYRQGTAGRDLWKYNPGTNESTQLRAAVDGVDNGLAFDFVSTKVGDDVFFTVERPSNQPMPTKFSEVWITDGTVAGTEAVDHSPNQSHFVGTLDDRLFFSAPATESEESIHQFTQLWIAGRDLTVAGPPVVTGPAGVVDGPASTLTWKAVTTAVAYEVRISNADTGGTDYVGRTTELSFDIPPTLQIGTNEIDVQVRAILDDGTLTAYSDHTYTVENPAPTVLGPIGLHHGGFVLGDLRPVTSARPTIVWDGVDGADRYELWVGNAGTSKRVIHEDHYTGTSFTPTSDLPDGIYRVWVKAKAPRTPWQTDWSEMFVFKIDQSATPSAPEPIAGIGNTVDRTPQFEWNESSGANNYELWVNKDGGTAKAIHETAITGTTFTPTENMADGDYTWWVRSNYQNGQQSIWSPPNHLTVRIPVPQLEAKAFYSTDEPTTFGITGGPNAYQFRVVVQNVATSETYRDNNIRMRGVTVDQQLAAGDYQAYVQATTVHGTPNGTWSPATKFSIGTRAEVLTPIGQTANTTPTFTWRAIDAAAEYELWVSRQGETAPLIREIVSATSYQSPTLLADGSYQTWVRTIYTSGQQSAWSEATAFEVLSLST